MTIASPILFWISVAITLAVTIVAIVRRGAMPVSTILLAAMGLILLAAAASGVILFIPQRGEVVVMVDVSASTRGATYRDRATLNERIQELLGGKPFRIVAFAETNRTLARDEPLDEMRSDHTRFEPPSGAPAVLLFSDGRFDLPISAPPTYAVMDPALADPADARVIDLEIRDALSIATVVNTGDTRPLQINDSTQDVGRGSRVITNPVGQAETITARFAPQDAWPENDALSIRVPVTDSRRWWVSLSAGAPDGFDLIRSDALPLDAAVYLEPSVVVLDNIPADSTSPVQLERLRQFVRDLGGSLVILGGDHAFAAGGYIGTALDALSPLASAPPDPRVHWILLADSSGSMSAPVDSSTRWQIAAQALANAIKYLPTEDRVSVGDFARELRWWVRDTTVREAGKRQDMIAPIEPRGPTNLAPALLQIVEAAEGNLPTQILVLSDADTRLDEDLSGQMRERKITLNLLATAAVADDNPVVRLARATGGKLVSQHDPRAWSDDARRLLQAQIPDPIIHEPARVRFDPGLAIQQMTIDARNAVWPRENTTPLATLDGTDSVVAARWQVGLGTVIAVGFAPGPQNAVTLARAIERAPRDPRFKITWDAGPRPGVRIDASDRDRFLNDLKLTLRIGDDAQRIPQVAPGRYELSFAERHTPAIATIELDARVIERRALPGRYPQEFAGIGNDRAALFALAQRSGGAVIEPDHHKPIDFTWPKKRFDPTSWLAAAGAGLIGLGLIVWRRA